MEPSLQAHRASILHFSKNAQLSQVVPEHTYFEDGILLIESGRVKEVAPAEVLLDKLPRNFPVTVHRDALIVPGFIDTHVHFPQVDVVASYGEQLLSWLNRYVYPVEARFSDRSYADARAHFFLKTLLQAGTTTALVFPTVHECSVDAFFSAAEQLGLRMICGKVLMDENAPPELLDTPFASDEQSRALIERWHKRERLLYAVTPRFALTSSEAQLKVAQKLLKDFPDIYLHTHLSETAEEVAQAHQKFPWAKNYLDVYDRFDLVRAGSVFAHAIHLDSDEYSVLAKKKAAVAFCPSSNLFLGSGLMNLEKVRQHHLSCGLGSDIGAGDRFCLLSVLRDAYRVLQLQKQSLSPFQAFYLATLGGAKALNLQHVIGNFDEGKEADFVVLDKKATRMLEYRMSQTQEVEQQLFLLMMLGDERMIRATYVMAKEKYCAG